MTQSAMTDEEIMRRLEAYQTYGSNVEAAKALGINEASIRRARELATRRNLDGTWLGGPTPPGYLMGKVTRHFRGDGTVEQEWQRQHPDIEAVEAAIELILASLPDKITPLPKIANPIGTTDNWLTLYPITDVHLGQLSWGKETGADYDLHIARDQFERSVSRLMQMSPNSSAALIAVVGDFFHADDNDAQTHKSHNHLDVDGRHDKTLSIGIELLIWMIDMALQKHQVVYVHITKGNHDEKSATALALALYYRYYNNNDRVIIDRDPKELWAFPWGVNMLAFTHGHRIKAEDMPGVMASQWAEMWGKTIYRYGYSGHYHKAKFGPKGGDEKHGARWEILPAFTEKDAFNAGSGHSAIRELTSITFDKEEGRLFQPFVPVK